MAEPSLKSFLWTFHYIMHFVPPKTLTGSQGPHAADVQMADPRAGAPGTMGFIGRKEQFTIKNKHSNSHA